MRRAYKEIFYPTDEQNELLAKSFWCARFVYNNTLRYRTDSYYKSGEKISHFDAEKQLIQVKKELPWLTEISSVIKYPSYKKKATRQSIRLTKNAFRFKGGKLITAKSKEPLRVKWSRELSSEPSSVTMSKDCAGRYFSRCYVSLN